ncbi:MAG: DUF1538 domain-containing protein [Bacteroidales bacterium]|nr:DUF1538 domain-containing protein [Bacteroidales bacterium]
MNYIQTKGKHQFHEHFRRHIKEATRSAFPIIFFILILGFTIVPIPVDMGLVFMIGAGLVVAGIAVFTMGAEMAMTPMGDALGDFVVRKHKLWFLVAMGLILGFIITIAEPGLIVLADQVTAIPSLTLIVTVAIGVAVFLAFGFLRTVFDLPMKYVLFGLYGVVFILAFFVPDTFLPMAFDSGGATTGAMTVPFIMALGVAIARDTGKSDSFGMIAICSIGPILTVMILGLIYTPDGGYYRTFDMPTIESTDGVRTLFLETLIPYIREVSLSLLPIVFLFSVLKIFAANALRVGPLRMLQIGIGVVLTFGGLVLFLMGANVGFLPMGNYLGQHLFDLDGKWLLMPIGAIIGYLMISAEPAIHVLNKQVDDVTHGAISKKAIGLSLSISVAMAVGLAMFRVFTQFPIMWVLLPGYAVAIGLSFFAPKDFTSIAFDAGGVASGPLTSAFLVPLTIGASTAVGGNILTDAFGVIALVALTPLITVQILGLWYKQTSGIYRV